MPDAGQYGSLKANSLDLRHSIANAATAIKISVRSSHAGSPGPLPAEDQQGYADHERTLTATFGTFAHLRRASQTARPIHSGHRGSEQFELELHRSNGLIPASPSDRPRS